MSFRKTRQQGWSKRRTWRKLRLGIDAASGEIVAETLTEAGMDDASQVKPLRAPTPGAVARLYGDAACEWWKVHHILAYLPAPRPRRAGPSGQDTPVEAVLSPRREAQARKAKRRWRHIEKRNQRLRAIRRRGCKRWKGENG